MQLLHASCPSLTSHKTANLAQQGVASFNHQNTASPLTDPLVGLHLCQHSQQEQKLVHSFRQENRLRLSADNKWLLNSNGKGYRSSPPGPPATPLGPGTGPAACDCSNLSRVSASCKRCLGREERQLSGWDTAGGVRPESHRTPKALCWMQEEDLSRIPFRSLTTCLHDVHGARWAQAAPHRQPDGM